MGKQKQNRIQNFIQSVQPQKYNQLTYTRIKIKINVGPQ
jgi:hypothetical protein